MSKGSIEGKLLRRFLLVGLVPLLIVGFLSVRHMRNSLWEEMLSDIAGDIADKEIGIANITNSLEKRSKLFTSNTIILEGLSALNRPDSGFRPESSDSTYQGIHEEISKLLAASNIISISIVGEKGNLLYEHLFPDTQAFFSGKSNSERILEASQPRFVRSRSGVPYLIVEVSMSATNKNQPVGLIRLVSKIEEIDDLLFTSKWPMALFNEEKAPILGFPDEIDPEISFNSAIEKGVSKQTGIEEYENYITAFRHIEQTGGTLVTIINRDEIFAPIDRLTKFFGYGGLFSVIAIIFIASLEAKKIVRPIKHLLKGVDEVASGNLETLVRISSGDEIESLGTRFNEMTERIKRRNRSLNDFKYALDQATIVAITDQKGEILYANDRFCEISKYSRTELIGQDHRIIKSGSHSANFIQTMWETIEQGAVWRGNFKNKSKDGSFYWVDATIIPFLDEQGKPYQYLSIRTDITKRILAEHKIIHLAQYDELTDLPNRAFFNERLDQTIKQRAWKRLPFAVMFLDMDRFKLVNDTLGHSAGDALLQQVAARLTDCLREEDTVARIGGDEFTILLPTIAKEEDAYLVGQKILDTLKMPFKILKNELLATGSIGISLFPRNGEDADTLLKNADAAMYRAKEDGRGRFSFYIPEKQTKKTNHLEIISSLSHAIQRRELLLHYQALVDIHTGKITGMEALIRWNKGGVGWVSPEEFIPLAESSGLILPIGDWVLRTAMTQLKSWHESGFPGLILSVNMSASQFQEDDFLLNLNQIVEEVGVEPKTIKLELTESLLMKNQEEVTTKLKEIKQQGFLLAIDDFGTGYSSLSYLKRFPIDTLKIDQSFVKNLPGNQDDTAIAALILSLAEQLKLDVVAEGIETEEQLTFLQARGCNIGQGHLFSQPLSARESTTLLQNDSKGEGIVPNLFKGVNLKHPLHEISSDISKSRRT